MRPIPSPALVRTVVAQISELRLLLVQPRLLALHPRLLLTQPLLIVSVLLIQSL